ncbi:signal peptidase I [Virgibacillus oceani]
MSKTTPMKETASENNSKQKKSSKSSVMSWVIFIIFLIGIFILFRYVIQFTVVSGDSMNPTLDDRDILLTSSLFYEVERYDVIIYQDQNGLDVIKRVIGMPHETVEIREGTIFVEGTPLEEDYTAGKPSDIPEVTVSEGSYFVIGDNRQPGASFDSRDSDHGPITENQIKGESVFSIFPPKSIK